MSTLKISRLVFLLTLVGVHLFATGNSSSSHLVYELADESPAGTLVGEVGLDSGLYSDDVTRRTEVTVLFLHRPGRSQSSLVSEADIGRLFSIDPSTGSLHTSNDVDRDVICAEQPTCYVELNVQAQKTISGRSSFTFVKVTVTFADENDNAPTFDSETATGNHVIFVSEGAAVRTRVSTLPVARDIDSPTNGIVRYKLSFESSDEFQLEADRRKPEDVFSAETDANDDVYLVLRQPLDRETRSSYSFELIAYDSGNPPLFGTTSVRVEVTDVNDNVPTFDQASYEISVPENVQIGTRILTIRARDPDLGANGEVVYSLKRRNRKHGSLAAATGPNEFPPFVVDPTTGVISTSDWLDYETTSSYVLTVVAGNRADSSTGSGSSSGGVASVAQTQVVINVTDVNDVAPNVSFRTAFDGAATELAWVTELLPVGAFVAHVTVVDSDPVGGTFDCRVDDESSFYLEELFRGEYQLVAMVSFDREQNDRYDVTVTCRDSSLTPLMGSARLIVGIDDVNDNRPTFPVAEYRIVGVIAENQPIGTPVVTIDAVDQDLGRNAQVEYRLMTSPEVNQNHDFRLDSSTGLLTTARSFDREKEPTVRVVVLAVDGGEPALSSMVEIVVFVDDEDDEGPHFTQSEYVFYVDEELIPDQGDDVIVGFVSAVDADLPPFNNITYFMDATRYSDDYPDSYPFRIDATSSHHDVTTHHAVGTILLDRPLDRELNDDFRFVVRACNSDGSRCDASAVRVIINDVNDHNPIFLFPVSPSNNTVYVGTDVGPYDVISRLTAIDMDIGDNGLISYKLLATTVASASSTPLMAAENYFRLDEITGEVFSRSEILHPGEYALPVAAIDGGGRQTVSALYVVVNASFSVGLGRRVGGQSAMVGWSDSKHITMAMIIGGTTCPVVILLLAAIGILSYRRSGDRGHHEEERAPAMTSPCDTIFFRKASGLQLVTSSSTVGVGVEPSNNCQTVVEYATLGRSRKLVPGGNRMLTSGLKRSNSNMAAGLSACDVSNGCCMTKDDAQRSWSNLSRNPTYPRPGVPFDQYTFESCRGGGVSCFRPIAKHPSGVGLDCGATRHVADNELTDSGRGSSEEVSGSCAQRNCSGTGRCLQVNGSRNSFCSAKNANNTLNDLSRHRAHLASTPVPDDEVDRQSVIVSSSTPPAVVGERVTTFRSPIYELDRDVTPSTSYPVTRDSHGREIPSASFRHHRMTSSPVRTAEGANEAIRTFVTRGRSGTPAHVVPHVDLSSPFDSYV